MLLCFADVSCIPSPTFALLFYNIFPHHDIVKFKNVQINCLTVEVIEICNHNNTNVLWKSFLCFMGFPLIKMKNFYRINITNFFSFFFQLSLHLGNFYYLNAVYYLTNVAKELITLLL